MQKKHYVILKGRKDGISILLDEHADFELIKTTLQKKVADARQFFEGANTNVAFKGRALSDEEEKVLLEIISSETTMDVSFIEGEGFVPPSINHEAMLTIPPRHVAYAEYVTAYHRGGLRSGQSIRYAGSLVIIGDANPGSEIIASGNIIVLGSLKGMVHAGAEGDDRCFVSALSLSPTQLRIANIITYLPPVTKETRKQAKTPAYAYIQDGQVYIAPLQD